MWLNATMLFPSNIPNFILPSTGGSTKAFWSYNGPTPAIGSAGIRTRVQLIYFVYLLHVFVYTGDSAKDASKHSENVVNSMYRGDVRLLFQSGSLFSRYAAFANRLCIKPVQSMTNSAV
jgi:hypothetical protein